VTAHVSIGSDIIHAHANCDGAALGQTSYTDFLIFADSIEGEVTRFHIILPVEKENLQYEATSRYTTEET